MSVWHSRTYFEDATSFFIITDVGIALSANPHILVVHDHAVSI